jgi:hypothetical protein
MKPTHKYIDKRSRSFNETYRGRHRYEHWLVDNQVYFITSSVRGHQRAFTTSAACAVFWDRFEHYTAQFGFVPWVTSLMTTHYHTLGYLREGQSLPVMIQRLHGSVAKLVNDLLPERIPEFWRTDAGKEYFDGCIRDEKQARLAYRYTLKQAERHGVCRDYQEYANTRVNVEIDCAVKRAHALDAFLEGVPYKRYLK